MSQQQQSDRYRPASTALLIPLVIYASLVIFTCHYERLTGDATLYLSIAEKYAEGDLRNAINGYWGPLLSWLLIPFLQLGATHLSAINSLNLIFGLLTIHGVWRLSLRFGINDKVRWIILVPLVPILHFISLIQPMDFLLLCILIYYLDIVFDKDFPSSAYSAASAGLLGAFAYFSKPYGFPFFITHFILISACQYFGTASKEQKKNLMKGLGAGLLVFSMLSGTWIGLISSKYGHLTFSNMGRGVFSVVGPGSAHKTLEKGDPIFYEGLFEPPNDTAFVIYEDPSYARTRSWSPLESEDALRHFIGNIKENILESIRIYNSYTRLSAVIVLTYILLISFRSAGGILSQRELILPLLTIALYTGGYMPFHFEARYLWIVNILLLLMGARVLSELLSYTFFQKPVIKTLLLILFALSFVLTPVRSSIEIGKSNINREMHELGSVLDERYAIRGNIASNRQRTDGSPHGSWHRTFRLSYWLKSRYFGQTRKGISNEELRSELQKNNIDYYFFWEGEDAPPLLLSEYREITNNEIDGLKIYSLKK